MTKLKTINTTAIEIIKWNDAQSDADWDEIKEPELAECTTVGFLVSENKKAVCIASTYSEPFFNAKINIPKSWIMNRKKINIKEYLAIPEKIREKEKESVDEIYTNT